MNLSNNSRQTAADNRRNFGRAIFRRFGAAAMALSSFLFLTACGESAGDRVDKVGGVTARQVIENPAAYVGKTVTVSGDVEEIWGPRAFNMDSGVTVGELLVVGREPFPQVAGATNRAYVINDVATVTGVVRMLVTADVEREIGWDLTPEIETEFNAKPVLIVQSVSFRAGAGGAATTPANMNQPMANNNSAQPMANTNTNTAGNRLTDVGVYASTADKLSLVGKDAQFSNLKVVRVVGPRTFTVASGNSEIYVMLDDASARGVGTQGKIDIGKTLNLTGRFERLQAAEINDLANNRFRALTEKERAFLKDTAVFMQASEISGLK